MAQHHVSDIVLKFELGFNLHKKIFQEKRLFKLIKKIINSLINLYKILNGIAINLMMEIQYQQSLERVNLLKFFWMTKLQRSNWKKLAHLKKGLIYMI